MRAGGIVAAIALGAAACGGGTKMGLTSEDNNPAALARAFSLASAPQANAPINSTGKPMVFLVVAGAKRQLLGFDLAAGKSAWSTEADVQSRVVVGRDFVAHVQGQGRIVGRDVATGGQRWSAAIDGTFLGLCAGPDRVFYVAQQQKGAKPIWVVVALDGKSGGELWRLDAPGQLGAPAARGGLVFVPFLKQWLTIVDARTGEQVARIRGLDEEISFVRATSDAVYFGSQAGVFLLDQRAASGKRAESTYGQAGLPKEFVRSFYHFDAFDPVQAGYSAYDRNRMLWRGQADGQALAFADNSVVVHHYRFLFGFQAGTGALSWAYSHPRNDLVASEHLGGAIGVVSQMGEVAALDPASGRRLYAAAVGGAQTRVLGATFDADGWKPSQAIEGDQASDTRDALAAIAIDKDARFNDVKMFAVTALGKQSGGTVTKALLALIQNEKTPAKVHEHAVQTLVDRKDPEGLPFLIEALAPHTDFVTGSKARGVGVVARTIEALAGGLDAEAKAKVAPALAAHLHDPETPATDLEPIIKALAALGGPAAMPALRRFLLAYRADPAFSTQIGASAATIDGLLAGGHVGDRELVAFVANDPATQQGIAEYARSALADTARRTAAAK